VLAAGLDGIKNKLDPGDPIHEDIYKIYKYIKYQLHIKHI